MDVFEFTACGYFYYLNKFMAQINKYAQNNKNGIR